MPATAITQIRWELSVLDKGSSAQKLLKQDRELRRGLELTDRTYKRLGTTVGSTSRTMLSTTRRTETSVRRVGRSATETATDFRVLSRAQEQQLRTATRTITHSTRAEQAYRRQARALRELTVAERAHAAAARTARAGLGGAAAAGAAAGGALRRGAGLAGVGGAGFAAAGSLRMFAGFEEQMDQVQARLDLTTKEMAGLNQLAIKLGKDTSFSAREAAAGMFELAGAGFSANQIVKTMGGTLDLAASSGYGLAESAQLQAAALRMFRLDAKDAGRVADVLAKTSNLSAVDMMDLGESLKYVGTVANPTRQKFEEILAAIGLLGNVGIKGSQAGTALRTSLLRLTDPTKKMQETFSQLNVDSSKLAAMPLPKVIATLGAEINKLPQGEKVGAVSRLFGKEASSAMLELFGRGTKELNRFADELLNADGYAKRASKTMRDNVTGAWDEFTGSIESTSIVLVSKFGPALKSALRSAGGAVDQIPTVISRLGGGIGKGLRGEQVQGNLIRGANGRVEGRDDVSKTAAVGQRIGAVAKQIGVTAAEAGRQLLDAFKPALPFFRNVLGPLLEGFGKGVLGGVVATFKILVPVIRAVSTVLGAIGRVAAPLKPVFAAIGVALGVVFGPAVLGKVAKLGGAFKLIGAAAKLLLVPIRILGPVFGVLGRGVLGALRVLSRINPAMIAVRLAIAKVPVAIANIVGTAARSAKRVASVIVKAFDVLRTLPGRVFSMFGKVGDRFGEIGKTIASRAVTIGTGLIRGVVTGLRKAAGSIGSVITEVAKTAWEKAKGGGIPFVPGIRSGGRVASGGRIQRFASGGLVTAAVSSGELLRFPGGGSAVVPGPRVAADNVLTQLPVGTEVYTNHGQQLLAAGASPGQALAMQMPHFAKGGVVGPTRIAAVGRRGGFKGRSLVEAVAIALAESAGKVGAIGPQTPHGRAMGLWQIMMPVHQALIRRLGGDVFDPTTNARAAYRISGGGKNWRPWEAFTNGAFRQHLDRARAAVTGSRGGGSGGSLTDTSAKVPIRYGRSRTRSGLIPDAFTQALDAARGGESIGRYVFQDSLREALRSVQTTRDVNLPGVEGGSRARRGGTAGSWSKRATMAWARAFASRHGLRISSSFRSAARNRAAGGAVRSLHLAGTPSNPHAFDFVPPKKSALDAARSLNPRPAEAMIHDAGSGLHLHVGLFRRGGLVGQPRWSAAMRPRGQGMPRLRAAANAVSRSKGGSLDAFAALAEQAMSVHLEALRRQLDRQVKRGGDAKVIARLQAALSKVDDVLGERIGKTLRTVDRERARTERGQAAVDRLLRVSGIDPSSSAGIQAGIAFTAREALPAAQRNLARLRRAAKDARDAGQPAQARKIEEEITALQEEIAELGTSMFERARELIAARAQERVTAAQFGLDQSQNFLSGLDIGQRLRGSADTPAGMLERAATIDSQLIPALQNSYRALEQQYHDLAAAGMGDAANQVFLQVQQTGNDIGSAMADSAQLIRDAGITAANELVESAAHRTTIASLGFERFQLEQRIAGTFDTAAGASARADFINNTLIPTLRQERDDLEAARRKAQEAGDSRLVSNLTEAILGKDNEILQAQLDGNEMLKGIEDNTADFLKNFGGSYGFDHRGQRYTDLLGLEVGT